MDCKIGIDSISGKLGSENLGMRYKFTWTASAQII
jgi:hypothetical protein